MRQIYKAVITTTKQLRHKQVVTVVYKQASSALYEYCRPTRTSQQL